VRGGIRNREAGSPLISTGIDFIPTESSLPSGFFLFGCAGGIHKPVGILDPYFWRKPAFNMRLFDSSGAALTEGWGTFELSRISPAATSPIRKTRDLIEGYQWQGLLTIGF